jgi:hypothetical protein
LITTQNINLLIQHAQEYNSTLKSVNNKLKTLTMIKSIIKNSGIKNYKIKEFEKLESDFKKIKTVRDDNINKNLKSSKYSQDEFNNLLRVFFDKQTQDKLTSYEKFILSLYLLTPPLRNNYYKIIYYDNKYDFDNDYDFRVKIYKDQMMVSKNILKVPMLDDLEITLKPYQVDLLKKLNLKNKQFITNFETNYFSAIIKRISKKAFGKNLGPNDFRHLFISSLNVNKLSNQDLQKIANSINQKKITTLLSYRKFKNK